MPVYLVYHSGEGIQNRGEGYKTADTGRLETGLAAFLYTFLCRLAGKNQ